jgi:hypothetical protein
LLGVAGSELATGRNVVTDGDAGEAEADTDVVWATDEDVCPAGVYETPNGAVSR